MGNEMEYGFTDVLLRPMRLLVLMILNDTFI